MSSISEQDPRSVGENTGKTPRSLRAYLPRARWWIPALAIHLCIGGWLAYAHVADVDPGEPEPVEMALEPLCEEAIGEKLEREIFENDKSINTDEPAIVDPLLKDAELSDHNETDNNEDYVSSKGAEDAVSDKPFHGKYWNSAIGIGGGSGGCFGGGRAALAGAGEGGPGALPSGGNTESYDHFRDNPFHHTADDPRSTFSVDVDTASYANVRRLLEQGRLPDRGAVRIEEMINYFDYDDAPPAGGDPFAVHMEVARCPWNLAHRLVRIGLKGRVIEREQRPPGNLVFLIDVSGSMRPANKLPLLQQAMKLLARQLTDVDYVSIVTYAGREALVLPSTSAGSPGPILAAIENLRSGGSTHGAAGIRLAYQEARKNFVAGGTNRVILATDGDFNVGVTSNAELVEMIQKEAKSGVFLTVLGFGRGNYKDSRLEKLADKGNGNYAYIDTLDEAKKVLVRDLSGTLVTIAKDVKIQVEFNPLTVGAFRLIGYENRVLAHRDFNDDTKDAGEIGAGHTVTALYEVMPASVSFSTSEVAPLKYQEGRRPSAAAYGNELLTLKLRHKLPGEDTSRLQTFAVEDATLDFAAASADFRFAAAVAAFGMLLRDSPHKGTASFEGVKELAAEGLADDPHGLRAEFVRLVDKAKALSR